MKNWYCGFSYGLILAMLAQGVLWLPLVTYKPPKPDEIIIEYHYGKPFRDDLGVKPMNIKDVEAAL